MKGKWDKPVGLIQVAPVWRQVVCDLNSAGVSFDFFPEVICLWTIACLFVREALFDEYG
jgi:hypothetical protein